MRKKIEITNEDTKTETGHAPDAETPLGSEDGPPSSGAEDYIVALQADLEDARTRLDEAEKRILYIQAEFQNYRRRKEEEFKDLKRFTTGELILSLLPIADNFERAMSAAEQTNNVEALVAGVSGTLKQLQTFLQKAGITPIESLGKEFDPKYHEAIGHTDSEEYPPHTVAEEVQRGYLMQDRVLRPALVKVTEG